jgi:hypothetical protein
MPKAPGGRVNSFDLHKVDLGVGYMCSCVVVFSSYTEMCCALRRFREVGQVRRRY